MGFLTIFYKYIIKSHYSRRWLSCPTWKWGGGVARRNIMDSPPHPIAAIAA